MLYSAFKLLGATPMDDGESLQELYDENRLIPNKTKYAEEAFTDLINPRRRISHEITYYESSIFDDFFTLDPSTDGQYSVIRWELPKILVNMGNWFDNIDENVDDLLEEVNDSRRVSGFPLIRDVDTIIAEVEDLKNQCIDKIIKYFDRLSNYSLVSLFNEIVIVRDFSSVFMDKLMAYYEVKISEDLVLKGKKCLQIAEGLDNSCLRILNFEASFPETGETIATMIDADKYYRSVTSNIEPISKYDLVAALKDFDYYAQPLQVNMQSHGGEHKVSSELVVELAGRFSPSQDLFTKKFKEVNALSLSILRAATADTQNAALNINRTIVLKYLTRLYKVIDFMDSLYYDIIQIFIELDNLVVNLKELKDSTSELKGSIGKMIIEKRIG